MEEKKVSKSVLKRLPGYLAYLKNMPENAPAHISATALARFVRIWPWSPTADAPKSAICGRP